VLTSCVIPVVVLALLQCVVTHNLLSLYRDVDQFIEYLQQTLDFFGNMGDGDELGESDDFVPFI